MSRTVNIESRRLSSWLAGSSPEGQRLEFKRALAVDGGDKKVELIKDLTAMGNGGGGTIVFGLSEREVDGFSFANEIVPLTDRSVVGRISDLVLDVVHPTLQWRPMVAEVEGGFVLIADIEPSPLGPYMTELKGEYRYWRRVGDRSVPMPGQMVHDLYAAAAIWQGARAERWQRLRLPLEPVWRGQPFLSVSGVPIATASGLFDPSLVRPSELCFEEAMFHSGAHGVLAGLPGLMAAPQVWADGFFSEAAGPRVDGVPFPPAPQVRLRLHRGAEIGVGAHIATSDRFDPVRMSNVYLAYLGRLWASRSIRSVELKILFAGFGRQVETHVVPYPVAERPEGAPDLEVGLDLIAAVDDLIDTTKRHKLLRAFANRISNAFGEPSESNGWESGTLHTANGPTELVGARGNIRSWASGGSFWPVAVNGSVREGHGFDARVGWWLDGALMDPEGNLLATVEFPTIEGLPRDFSMAAVERAVPEYLDDFDPEATSQSRGAAMLPEDAPGCTGRWADGDPVDNLRAR